MKKVILLITFFALLFSSCEKVIELDLKSSEIKYVLKGEVVSGESTHHLSITTSTDFNQTNSFPEVNGAFVTLSDELGNTATMVDMGGGDYVAQNYLAYEGRTYTMKVIIGDKTIESTCTIPYMVNLVGVLPVPSSFFGAKGGKMLMPEFQDPAQDVNFYKYRFTFKKYKGNYNNTKDTLLDSGDIIDDDIYSNGQINKKPAIGSYFPVSKDTVTFRMYGIPKSVHTFYFSKQTNTNSDSGSPANPISNWSGDVLGYFTAHNLQEVQIVIP